MRQGELCVHTLSILHGSRISLMSPNTHFDFSIHLVNGNRKSVNAFTEILS